MKRLILLAIVTACGCDGGSNSPSASVPSANAAPPEVVVRSIMSNGNGRDFMRLTDRDRLRLCMEIERTIGQHDAHHYHEFLFTFYDRARSDNSPLLGKRIAEVAAVAAAIKE